MKVGVISDTHIAAADGWPRHACEELDELHQAVAPHFADVQAVLHAGDITSPAVLEMLGEFGPVHAVAGNMDPARLGLPDKRVVELGGRRIGMMHGRGGASGIRQLLRQSFDGQQLDCIVFGHSHHPWCKPEGGVLLFNPGSPTDRRYAPSRAIGLLHLDDARLWGEHVELD